MAQLSKIKSIDIELPFGVSRPEYNVRTLNTGGFLLEEKNENIIGKKNNLWTIKKYSNDLDLVWSEEIPIDFELDEGILTITKDAYYQSFTSSNSQIIKILKIDLQKGENEWIEGELVGIQEIFQMKIIGNTAFFSGKFQGRAVVMGLSFFNKKLKVVNGLYSNYMEVVEIEADETEKLLQVYSKNRYKRQCQLLLNVFDEEGQQVSKLTIENDPKKIAFNGRVNKINSNESMVIGNYSRSCDNFSQGIYVKKFTENAEIKSKYLDFSEFNNFFNYLNPKRQKKVQERLSKRKSEGKDLKFNYSMLLHKLYQHNNQLIMVAEIYYAEPRNNTGTPFMVNGKDFNPFIYRFTHTIICGFDKDGNKLWDNCLPMKALRSFYLNRQVQLSFENNKLILAYPEEGKIKTQLIEEGKNIGEKETFEVIAKNSGFFDDNDLGGLSAWYDQNFLSWGFKTEPDPNNVSGKKVFFINKLTYDLVKKSN